MPQAHTITRRLTLFTVIAVLTIGTLGGFSLHELAQWNDMALRLARESQEASLDGIFHSALTRATGEAVSYAATGNQDYAREASDALLYAQSALAQLRRIGAERPPAAGEDEIRSLRQEQEELLSRVRRSVTQALRLRPSQEALSKERLELLYAPETDADRAWLAVVAWHDGERKLLNRSLRTLRHRVLLLVGATVLASLLWSMLLHAFVVRELIAPTQRLVRFAQRIADGDPELRVPPMGEGDIGALREALDRIAQGRRPPAAAAAPDRTDAEAMPSPLGAVETGPPDASPDPTEAPSAAPKRALLVAADPAERDLTRAMLQHCGVTVTVADDAAAAADTAYDLIVIDRPLPGNALLAGQRPPGRGGRPVPAIVLGVADGGDTPEGFVPGVDARLKRPFSFFDLHAELSRIFGES